MKPYYDSANIKIYNGHALEILKSLPENSVQCCVTSPPYFGLRDYSTESLIWDGDENCEHEWVEEIKKIVGGHSGGIESSGLSCSKESIEKKTKGTGLNKNNKYAFCQKCKAWKGSLGLEPTPELFVDHLVQIFREVKRILRKDGTLWLNLGDSYNGSGGAGGDYAKGGLKEGQPKYPGRNCINLKPKDLVGIPWRVAFALQADGWYLRQDIIWHKPNPMPESVTDRCTKSHEYIFLLTKSSKYYYNTDAIKEQSITNENRPNGIVRDRDYNYNSKQKVLRSQRDSFKRKNSSKPDNLVPGQSLNSHRYEREEDVWDTNFRNKRSVWSIATKPYKEAHFATFSPELPRTCILAGSKKGDTILDPFTGALTTLMVSQQLNRNSIGIELNKDYINIGLNRLKQNYFDF